MINVTYVGDTLIAFKVTGDKNVPRGEITFQADLTPPAVRKFRGGRRTPEEALGLGSGILPPGFLKLSASR